MAQWTNVENLFCLQEVLAATVEAEVVLVTVVVVLTAVAVEAVVEVGVWEEVVVVGAALVDLPGTETGPAATRKPLQSLFLFAFYIILAIIMSAATHKILFSLFRLPFYSQHNFYNDYVALGGAACLEAPNLLVIVY
jgi:hypothetical protein